MEFLYVIAVISMWKLKVTIKEHVYAKAYRKMLDPLLSRFVIIKVEKYSFEEFKQEAMKVLNSGS